MSKRILIVDDDSDFSALLTGVFQQAEYEVITATNVADAFDFLQQEVVDLVVTDQRLPGLSGLEFVRQLNEMDIHLPTIMVSGYLDDDSIRELIRSGIDGIFMKPLNIFSLLKKASDLLENKSVVRAVRDGPGSADALDESADHSALASVGGICGLSETGRDFLRRAYEACGFKRNLLLIGPVGTLFEEIGRDLVRIGEAKDIVGVVRGGQIDAQRMADFLDPESRRGTTLIVVGAEQLSFEEIQQFDDLSESRAGTGGRLRLILCLCDSVENLYDTGIIDEELYLFFGANELQIPALKDIPEDTVAMVLRMLEERGPKVAFDNRLRQFLMSQQWRENMVELRAVTLRALSLSQPMPPQLKHFKAAIENDGSSADAPKGGDRSHLERFLRQEKQHYRAAMRLLTDAQD